MFFFLLLFSCHFKCLSHFGHIVYFHVHLALRVHVLRGFAAGGGARFHLAESLAHAELDGRRLGLERRELDIAGDITDGLHGVDDCKRGARITQERVVPRNDEHHFKT
jgi:hypothetical protein